MSLDLALLRRRLVDGESVTVTDRDPRTDGVCSYILFRSEAREIVEWLERAERLEAKLRELDDAGTDGLDPGSVLWVALMGIEEVLES